jgi:hypothetical protein
MGKYYIITNWRGGYYSEDRDSFGGILFATRYMIKDTAERKITDKLIDTKESPFFIVEAYE